MRLTQPITIIFWPAEYLGRRLNPAATAPSTHLTMHDVPLSDLESGTAQKNRAVLTGFPTALAEFLVTLLSFKRRSRDLTLIRSGDAAKVMRFTSFCPSSRDTLNITRKTTKLASTSTSSCTHFSSVRARRDAPRAEGAPAAAPRPRPRPRVGKKKQSVD